MEPTPYEPNGISGVQVTEPYMLRRLDVVMRPEPGNQLEAGGVLNPGGVRGGDGEYYLFPRLVAENNYSRVGIARVNFDGAGVPRGVERLGVALEPEAPYELNRITGGGCEDPRVTYVPTLGVYVMAYAAFGAGGPRAALAVSTDLFHWTRRGLVDFAPLGDADMNAYGNKDAMVFPEPVPGPDGRPAIALLHRPMYEEWHDENRELLRTTLPPPGGADARWSIWISYCPLEDADWASPHPATGSGPPRFRDHHLLITPQYPWEILRLGGGTPPIRVPQGWLTIYHGISAVTGKGSRPALQYSAGALVLDVRDPRKVLYRSATPTLEPMLDEERAGVVSNVVFPTAVDQHERYVDVYYGMADACIGVARMETPMR